MRHFIKNHVQTLFLIVSLLFHSLMILGAARARFDKNVDEKIEISLAEEKPVIEKVPEPEQPKPELSLPMLEQNQNKIVTEEPDDAEYLSEHNQKANQSAETKSELSKVAKILSKSSKENLKPAKTKANTVPEVDRFNQDDDVEVTDKVSNVIEIGSDESDVSEQTESQVVADTGTEALVSTREFKYYAYCKMIKDKIQVYWAPNIKAKFERILSQSRSVASQSERTTHTVIVLDRTGALEKVEILGGSGFGELDDAALEALRAATPFPNPPQGIVEEDGKIRILWDFILSERN